MTKTYKFFNKEISGFFTMPSGIIATEVSILKKIANEILEIGILTTKSIGIEPRQGNREPIIAQYSSHSFVNAVGLTKEFLTKCGIGLCGSCATLKGYRSCVDGTFFNQ